MLSLEDTYSEFRSSCVDDNGNGYHLVVSVPVKGYVDFELWQVVGGMCPEEPQVSMQLPARLVPEIIEVFKAGLNEAS